MGQTNLNRIFHPKRIAVVGASEKPGTIGDALMRNLNQGNFSGILLPVNPRHKRIHGIPSFSSVSELREEVDLVLIATPIHTVTDIIRDCVAIQAAGAVVISAGGKEAGEQGIQIETRIKDIAGKGGLRIIGPNCMGIICANARLNASFAPEMPDPGNLAFVSQSGAICGAILDLAFREHIGFSHFVSIGSMLDVDFGDLVDYLGNDPCVRSILLYIENLTNFRKFMSAARAVSRVKPIIVLKAGRSLAGAKAAASHTGAMAGEDDVYDAAFKRAGIVRVETIQELFDCAELLAKQPRPRGPRLAIVTNGGGPGVMAVDYLARHGQEPATLDEKTMQRLDSILPPFWSRGNPIDMLGDASAARFRDTLNICLDASGIDGVLVIFVPQALTDPHQVALDLASSLRNRRYPIVTCWMGGKRIENAVAVLNQNGIPTYDTPERAVRAFLYLVEYARNMEMLLQIPPRLTRNMTFDPTVPETLLSSVTEVKWLTESESKEVLQAYGLPVIQTDTATNMEEAVRAAERIGYPVVLKLHSPDISHKTDVGGVQLNLRNANEIRDAFERILEGARNYRPDARILGVTVQPHLERADYEILLGAKRDASFGPVILFGTGGIFTEIVQDRALGLPPLNRLLAGRLMESTRAWKMIAGYRNRQPADRERLEEMIVRLSQLLIDFPEIQELDMNPVLIQNGLPVAVDARILVSPAHVPSPMHLVISPYPEIYESHMVTEEGVRIFIRPVQPEDAPLFIELFQVLSPTSIYYRFFGALKSLTPEMLVRFTQIDYDREIALVALEDGTESGQMLGVARIIGDPDGKTGEFAVLVGDPWHGRGIGSNLLGKCLQIAEQRGFETVTGIVLPENRSMLKMGEKLGFSMKRLPGCGECELVIHLKHSCR